MNTTLFKAIELSHTILVNDSPLDYCFDEDDVVRDPEGLDPDKLVIEEQYVVEVDDQPIYLNDDGACEIEYKVDGVASTGTWRFCKLVPINIDEINDAKHDHHDAAEN